MAERGEGKRLEEGIRALRRAIALHPWLGEPHALLARALERQGGTTEALDVLGRALERLPAEVDLLRTTAQVHERAGQPQLARVYWERLARQRPDDPMAKAALHTPPAG